MADASLTLFFPCYNEEDNVRQTIQAAEEAAKLVTDDFEIIIINDGSEDKTGVIADGIAAENSRVRVIHHPKNRGYGAALRSGFGAAKGDVVFYSDGDLQFDLREITRLWPLMGEYDMVTGYRKVRKDPLHRRLFGFCWSSLMRVLFNLPVRDVNCAFNLIRQSVLTSIELHAQGGLISAEILARAQKAGYRISEVGVGHYPRHSGKQKGSRLSVLLEAFRELPSLWWQLRNR